ncbi:hypothetical protein ASD15_27640 [Massilia sp. Root351]|uniref:prepilin-type N-terminal cleavage/methylation domain-containing protein n=1 Tax=Massilia sp. Root351 TaxID=1736522 RepID=UPI00071082FA|nr:prepilin-type N-terminal cleavage/methylation domain-containing protein [Massilia sp. Root351]KQV87829.1 hypothetical protein ASD15_27640 [Massilia sp. Root351]
MKRRHFNRRARGFTLVEAIIVIVITGIVAGMVAVFIRAPVQSYVDTAARAELSDTADLVLRRMSRELRLALPNSMLLSNDGRSIGFLLTSTGGRYIDETDNPVAGVLPLSFTNTAATTFHMAGAAPVGREAIVPGNFIVVYNLGRSQAPADAYSMRNVARVTAVNGTLITMNANPFANENPVMPSPDHRFQVVTGAVTYQCGLPAGGGEGTLTRFFSNQIPLNADVPAPVAGTGQLMAGMVAACEFRATQLATVQAALVTITLTLRHRNGEQVTLVRQVHVDNTP